MNNLVEYAKQANHCQRNWSNRSVDEDMLLGS